MLLVEHLPEKISIEESYKFPLWHKEILDEREKQIENGNDEFEDWEDVKKYVLDATQNV